MKSVTVSRPTNCRVLESQSGAACISRGRGGAVGGVFKSACKRSKGINFLLDERIFSYSKEIIFILKNAHILGRSPLLDSDSISLFRISTSTAAPFWATNVLTMLYQCIECELDGYPGVKYHYFATCPKDGEARVHVEELRYCLDSGSTNDLSLVQETRRPGGRHRCHRQRIYCRPVG